MLYLYADSAHELFSIVLILIIAFATPYHNSLSIYLIISIIYPYRSISLYLPSNDIQENGYLRTNKWVGSKCDKSEIEIGFILCSFGIVGFDFDSSFEAINVGFWNRWFRLDHLIVVFYDSNRSFGSIWSRNHWPILILILIGSFPNGFPNLMLLPRNRQEFTKTETSGQTYG